MTHQPSPDGPTRVTLRPLAAGDQDEFIDLVAASADLHRPWMSLPATPGDFQAYVTRRAQSGEESFLVCVRATGAIAGLININSIIRGRFQCGSLSYAAFAPAAGHGYLSEGVGLVLHHAFEHLRLHRLEAQIQPDNHASLKLIRRAGFRYEGRSPELLFINGAWRDHERWAITNTMAGMASTRPHPTLPER